MNPDNDSKRMSKFLSLVLRHNPGRAGIQLDEQGWVEVDLLLAGCARAGMAISNSQLLAIVASSDKQRFALSSDGLRIRANQGHSIEVDLQHEPQAPPERLYHGTAGQFVPLIRLQGLSKMRRHHVHLSEDVQTMLQVGARRGRPVLLEIRSGDMHRSGHVFWKTPNNVWLADHVPPQFIEFPPTNP